MKHPNNQPAVLIADDEIPYDDEHDKDTREALLAARTYERTLRLISWSRDDIADSSQAKTFLRAFIATAGTALVRARDTSGAVSRAAVATARAAVGVTGSPVANTLSFLAHRGRSIAGRSAIAAVIVIGLQVRALFATTASLAPASQQSVFSAQQSDGSQQ